MYLNCNNIYYYQFTPQGPLFKKKGCTHEVLFLADLSWRSLTEFTLKVLSLCSYVSMIMVLLLIFILCVPGTAAAGSKFFVIPNVVLYGILNIILLRPSRKLT